MNYNERLSKIRELCIKRIKQFRRVNDAGREELRRCILDLIYSSKGRSFIGYCDSFIKEYEKFDDKIREALVRLYLIMTVGDKANKNRMKPPVSEDNKVSPPKKATLCGGSEDDPGPMPAEDTVSEDNKVSPPKKATLCGGGEDSPEPMPPGDPVSVSNKVSLPKKATLCGSGEDSPEPMPPGDPVSVSNKVSLPKKATLCGSGEDSPEPMPPGDPVSEDNKVSLPKKATLCGGGEDLPRITEDTSSINKSTQDQEKELENDANSGEQTIIELIVSIVYNSVKTQKEKGI